MDCMHVFIGLEEERRQPESGNNVGLVCALISFPIMRSLWQLTVLDTVFY